MTKLSKKINQKVVIGVVLILAGAYLIEVNDSSYVLGALVFWGGICSGILLVGYGATEQIASITESSSHFVHKVFYLYKFVCILTAIVAILFDIIFLLWLNANSSLMLPPSLIILEFFGCVTPIFWIILFVGNSKK